MTGRRDLALQAIDEDGWRVWRDLRLQALAEAPSAFGSKLSEWQGNADTEDRWRDRLRRTPLNLIGRLDQTPAGMVSATAPDAGGTVELISMWVAPRARGRGLGDSLVRAVLRWARTQGAHRVLLCVMDANLHAKALYARHGFEDRGSLEDGSRGGPCERRMVHAL